MAKQKTSDDPANPEAATPAATAAKQPLFHVHEKNHPAMNIYAADEDEARKLYAAKIGLNLSLPGDHPILVSRVQGY